MKRIALLVATLWLSGAGVSLGFVVRQPFAPQTLPSSKSSSAATSKAVSLSFSTREDGDDDHHPSPSAVAPLFSSLFFQNLPQLVATTLLSASLLMGSTIVTPTPTAHAFTDSKVVGALKGSGLVFKDTLQIERFDDPKVKGVVLYISNFDRPITEKLGGNFFNDPAYASVACARTGGPVSIADNIAKGPGGEEVFQESRSLLFKTLRVQRVYDEERQNVVYVSYNTRLDKSSDDNKSRFKSSLCAVNLE